MINILSYVGMNMQSEVCLWCLLGLVRTIFDATLFKVNANLKQVWQMNMPAELSKPVQRVLRTMVSGVMLVQCFTVYVYLAAYIVLLYPVFLEERPALVLPWLLLAAVRKLLCELTSLALGLGTCLLLGPARPPCIKFVVVKFAVIMPAFYMWMLVFSYYHALKVATAFKTFPAVLPPNDNDYGLELAVRRRRTKSMRGEEQVRKKLVANFYGEGTPSATDETYLRPVLQNSSRIVISIDASFEEECPEADVMKPSTAGWSDIGAYAHEDWFGSEVMIPRDTDRILEQVVLMLLRICAYLKKEGKESITASQILNSAIPESWPQQHNIDCTAINGDDTETPPHIGSSKGNIALYLREYPQIFMKKQGNSCSQTELTFATLKSGQSHVENDEGTTSKYRVKLNSPSSTSYEEISLVGVEKVPSRRKITITDSSNTTPEDKTVKLTMPPELQTERTTKAKEKKKKYKLKNQRALESEKYASEVINKVLDDLLESNTSAGDYKKAIAEIKHSNNNKIKDSTETLNNDNIKKNTHFEIPNAGNSKTHTPTANQTPKKNNNDKSFVKTETVEKSLIQSKLLNTEISNKASDITILNETAKEESVLSEILNVESNEQFTLNGIDNGFKSNDNKISIKASDETMLIKNNNRESTRSQIFNLGNIEKFSYDSNILKAGTSSKIPNINHTIKERNSEINEFTKEESVLSQILNVENNEKFTPNGIDNAFKSNDNKISTKASDETMLIENNNRESTRSKIFNLGNIEKFSYDSNILKAGTSSKIPNINHTIKERNSEINEFTKEESVLSQILNVENNEKFTPNGIDNAFKSNDNKISTKASDETMLIENNNRESTRSKIFNLGNIEKFSYDSNILKTGTSSKIPNINHTIKERNSEINEFTKEESVLSQILNVENNEKFTPNGIDNAFKSNDNKISTKASDETMLIENNNRESTRSKIFNLGNIEKFSYDSSIMKAGTSCEIPNINYAIKELNSEINEFTKEESVLSQILNVENNEKFTPNGIDNAFKSNDNKISTKASDETMLIENNNRESTRSKIFNLGNIEKFSYDSNIMKAGTSCEIPNINYAIKELNSDLLNLRNITESSQKNTKKAELTETQISKDDKNNELPLRILSNDGDIHNITDTLGVKVSNKDSSDDKIPNEVDNKVPSVHCHCRQYK